MDEAEDKMIIRRRVKKEEKKKDLEFPRTDKNLKKNEWNYSKVEIFL